MYVHIVDTCKSLKHCVELNLKYLESDFLSLWSLGRVCFVLLLNRRQGEEIQDKNLDNRGQETNCDQKSPYTLWLRRKLSSFGDTPKACGVYFIRRWVSLADKMPIQH